MSKVVFGSPLWDEARLGHISSAELYADSHLNPEVAASARALQDHYKVAMLTNTQFVDSATSLAELEALLGHQIG